MPSCQSRRPLSGPRCCASGLALWMITPAICSESMLPCRRRNRPETWGQRSGGASFFTATSGLGGRRMTTSPRESSSTVNSQRKSWCGCQRRSSVGISASPPVQRSRIPSRRSSSISRPDRVSTSIVSGDQRLMPANRARAPASVLTSQAPPPRRVRHNSRNASAVYLSPDFTILNPR